jgi:hydrophobic W protein
MSYAPLPLLSTARHGNRTVAHSSNLGLRRSQVSGVVDGAMIGTTGQSLRLEAVVIHIVP